jgi:hypothetical protein
MAWREIKTLRRINLLGAANLAPSRDERDLDTMIRSVVRGEGYTRNRQERNRDFKFFPCFRRRGQMCTGYGFIAVCFATVAQSRYKFCTDSGKFAIIEAIAMINRVKDSRAYFVS